MNGADIMPFDGMRPSWRNQLKDDALGRFVRSWFSAERPMRPPQDNGLHFMDGLGANLILYREGQFQVQLCLVQPNTVLPPHRHQNVESYVVHLSGEVWFKCESHGYFVPEHHIKMVASDGTSAMRGFVFYLGTEDEHSGHTEEMGASFLSIQKWREGIKPTCIARDWTGEQISDAHGFDILTSKAQK